MKTSILEEFAYGNLEPLSNNYGRDPEYRRVLGTVLELEEKFLGALNDSEKELYSKYTKDQDELEMILNTNAFTQGYRLGVLMTIEVYTGGART